ncbi:phosphoinositide phospholipase C 2-like isoform X1 [Phoenix dactylifera]|uniref:Phosphoinositide phospholipase C n=1 Tax=Phoenix dactylifera TaxID=42345 RepID=A0A8B9AR87_PHODC|nr:phosphoinositide phospholipase C 2-like isoform X1 [Phoenix dactylifera]
MTTYYRVCFCFRRRFLPATNEPPAGVKEVFQKYSEGGVMGAEQLQRFLVEVQGEPKATREAAQAVIDGMRELKHLGVFQKKGLSLDAFFRYLTGDDNSALSHSLGVHQDMRAPLSHYFIYTGHNSYLTGNQLSSDCSDIPIIKALQRGVRVIELDIWPNSTKDDVEVHHGGTLTTPVELLKCLQSIKEHAFSVSPYPVIITLEDHLTPKLQAKVAEMITDTYGDMLFTAKAEFLEELPSPEALQMKILISTKPPKEYLESKIIKEEDQAIQKGTEDEAWGTEVPDLKAEISDIIKVEHVHSEHHHEEEDPDEGDKKPHQIVAPEYKHLIAIAAKKRKGELSDAFKVDPDKATRLSLSELVFEKAVISHGTEIIRFTRKNLLRIYPKGTRITSSNYNPLPGWMHGAQMVALNMQGYGRALWLVHGMFRANGGCGYVKKPDFLFDNVPYHIFDPKVALPVKKTLKVKVYMGDGWRFDFHQTHFDTYSPPDFYTRVGIAGVPADTVMKRTKAVEDNWTPVWDEEFQFPLTVPELALLRIEVHEYDMSEKDDFAGQTCLPVWELRPGIRSVPLCDREGEALKSVKLLMHFEFL